MPALHATKRNRNWALPRRQKARCPTRRRHTMLRLLLALALAVPAAGQEPKSTATPVCATAAVSSPAGDNGCNYGACKSLTSGTLNCAYDNSFCSSTEEWMTAQNVIDAGEECTCEDILDYPMNIGTCSSSGVYSPMALASDCSGGTAVCSADTDGHYFLGDTAAGATQFTACDLKCDGTAGHTADIPTDTFQGCEFPRVDWVTLAQQTTGRFYSRHMHMMGDMAIIGGLMKSTVEPGDAETAATKYGTLDFELRGPFSRADPDGSEGTSVYEDVKSYDERARPRHQNMFEVALGSDVRAISLTQARGTSTRSRSSRSTRPLVFPRTSSTTADTVLIRSTTCIRPPTTRELPPRELSTAT